MATAIETSDHSRFTDIFDEPVDRLLSVISGYEDQPFVSLIEATKPISSFFNDVEAYVYIALHSCENPSDGLTQNESAALHIYTMQFYDGPSLYVMLNQVLRTENRDELKPWFLYLKLFLTALYKLPSHSGTVWRGIKNVDFSSKYTIGTKFVWWGVGSCTTDIEVLESNSFFSKTGLRTLFSMECINGKSISNHSYFKNNEKEIVLMPGSYFEVIGQLNPAPELYIIQLKEILPAIVLINPPFYNHSTIVTKSSRFSQLLSKMKPKSKNTENIVTQMPLNSNTNWKQDGLTIAGGCGYGKELYQLCSPHGICIDDNKTIYIADSRNHRIVEWKSNRTNGCIVAGGNDFGNNTNQLFCPTNVIIDKKNNSFIITDRDNRRVMRWFRENHATNGEVIIKDIDCLGLTIDKNGSIYISDVEKNEVTRWKRGRTKKKVVAGGNGQGNQLNQLNSPSFIFVDENDSLYVSDSENHRVMKWLKGAKKGIIVAGGNGSGNSLRQLSFPQGVFVNHLGQIYVVDCYNHRVMCWCEGDKEGRIVVGGNGQGKKSNQLSSPRGLSFDAEENLYVVDSGNDRIQKFEIDFCD